MWNCCTFKGDKGDNCEKDEYDVIEFIECEEENNTKKRVISLEKETAATNTIDVKDPEDETFDKEKENANNIFH